MLPAAIAESGPSLSVFAWLLGGFAAFFALEQFLHWHHCHKASARCKQPLTYLILLGDGLHNLLGGMAVAGTFLIDVRLGLAAWVAAALHEVPQELGDFGVLVHGGWGKARALAFNALSGATFLVGGIIAYAASRQLDVVFLVPFAAGNFVYIAASDLVPEVNKQHGLGEGAVHFVSFAAGLVLLFAFAPGP